LLILFNIRRAIIVIIIDNITPVVNKLGSFVITPYTINGPANAIEVPSAISIDLPNIIPNIIVAIPNATGNDSVDSLNAIALAVISVIFQ
jgi:hypothetical protein